MIQLTCLLLFGGAPALKSFLPCDLSMARTLKLKSTTTLPKKEIHFDRTSPIVSSIVTCVRPLRSGSR